MKRRAVLAAAAALAVAAAGCGTVNGNARPRAAPPPPPSLNTSLATAGGTTWAVAVLGGSAAQHNNFWQLFARPAGSQTWRLVTPPGVASNGGLVLAGLPGQSALAAFLPSQALVFSPLAATSDSGRTWSAGVLDGRLASVPDALAAAPGGGRFVALLAGGGIDQAGSGAATWSALTSMHSLSAAPAGRDCSPAAPTAVSFSPSGAPLLAVACTRPGVAGIFSYAAGTWQAAAPALPAAEAGRRVQVLRLTSTPAGEIALLAVRSGHSTDLLTAWTSDGTHWTVSGPLSLGAATVRSSGFAAAGGAWVLLANGQAATIAGKTAAWRRLPQSPPDSAALALGPGGSADALAAHGSKLTDWRLASGSGGWRKTQVLGVPIQYGSSG